MIKKTAALGLALALAACADQPPAPMPDTKALMPKISLDVQAINLADRSGLQPAKSPYNTNHFAPTIDEAIKQWAGDRLQAVGQNGQAIIIIKDASLIAQPLQTKSGIDGWFTRQQSVKYIGHAEVSIEANGRPGFATADAVATRAVTLPENPTGTEKQDAYYSLLNGLMKDLGQNMDASIEQHMNRFIVTAPIYGATAVPAVTAAPAIEQADIQAPIMDSAAGTTMPPLAAAPSSFQPQPLSDQDIGSPSPAASASRSVIPLSGTVYK